MDPKPSSKLEAFFRPGGKWTEPLSLLRELLLFGGLVEDFQMGQALLYGKWNQFNDPV